MYCRIDFAMAYSCDFEYQDEADAQSARCSQKSVNLFTMALFIKGQKCNSFIGVTNSPGKGKDTIYAFVKNNLLTENIDFGSFSLRMDHPASLRINS